MRLGGSVGGAVAALRRVQAFRDNPLALFRSEASSGGDIVFFDLGVRPAAVVTAPPLAAAFLTHADFAHDPRPYGPLGSFRGYRVLQDLIGRSLPVLDGAEAHSRRRWIQPAFAGAQRAWNAEPATPLAERLEELLATSDDGVVDLQRVLARLMFEQLCSILFGEEYRDMSGSVSDLLESASRSLHRLSTRYLPWAQLMDPIEGVRLRRARRTLAAFSRRIVADLEEKRQAPGPVPAAFSTLPFHELTRGGLEDEVLTQLVVGPESTSLAASWTLLSLALNPEIHARVRAETDSIPPQSLRQLTLSSDSPIARSVREGLRLYPSFWQFLRVAQRDTVVEGHAVAKDTIVFLCPYLAHRNAARFERPEVFDPWRREAEEGLGASLLTYGFGFRSCVGARLATSLLMDTVATVTRNYDVTPLEGHTEVEALIFGLRRRGGFRCEVRRRLPVLER